jgi:aromatic-L-amino-acid/L-tryptophan decarboxylase
MVLRTFGEEGLRARIREHIRLARLFAGWVEADAAFELMAPAPMAVVCFRVRVPEASDAALDRLNEEIVQAVNASGKAYLTQTRIRGRTAIRLAVGNVLTTEAHVRGCWDLVRSLCARHA